MAAMAAYLDIIDVHLESNENCSELGKKRLN
jgi:hypothetical protein